MKKFIILSLLIACLGVAVNAQEFITVPQRCPQCWGNGLVASYYGPVRCPGCGGYGVIQVTVRNPNYNSNVSFRGNNSDGYIHKGTIRLQRVISGTYDHFDYYVKRGVGYVKYHGLYYSLSGRYVTINNVKYYT